MCSQTYSVLPDGKPCLNGVCVGGTCVVEPQTQVKIWQILTGLTPSVFWTWMSTLYCYTVILLDCSLLYLLDCVDVRERVDEYVNCSLLYLLDCVDVRERVCSADNIDISVTCPSQVGMAYIR